MTLNEIAKTGNNVLISEQFYYFGDNAPLIPNLLIDICHSTQGQKILDEQLANEFLSWLTNSFHNGIQGKPINRSMITT